MKYDPDGKIRVPHAIWLSKKIGGLVWLPDYEQERGRIGFIYFSKYGGELKSYKRHTITKTRNRASGSEGIDKDTKKMIVEIINSIMKLSNNKMVVDEMSSHDILSKPKKSYILDIPLFKLTELMMEYHFYHLDNNDIDYKEFEDLGSGEYIIVMNQKGKYIYRR